LTKPKRIFVSNRLPFSINSKTGDLKRGSGGLVSALLGVHLDQPFYWLGFETEGEVAQQLAQKSDQANPHLRLHPVVLEKRLYDSYYDKFCNDVLWPLFHYEGQHVFFHRENWNAYIQANRLMADEILKIAVDGDTVWIHDFHFLLLPEMLKQTNPNLKIGLFLHTPFPSSEIFRQLPVREDILRGMILADLVGFHEHSYLRHFTISLTTRLGIDSTFFKAEIDDHTLHLGVYPISIDNEGLRQRSVSPRVLELSEKFQQKIKSPFLILGVDRLDYSKGLELKLKGFRKLLQKYSELRGQVSLLQVAVPTRTKVPAYIRLKREIDQLVGTINGEFGQLGYTPVNYIFNSITENELLALYRRADCVLITSKRDGMNLVAMEYAVSQDLEDPGMIVLSEFAGASSLLVNSIMINPWDEDSVADALNSAYHMPMEERREKLQMTQEMLSKYSATQWAHSFLKDLDAAGDEPRRRPTLRISPKTSESQPKILDQIGKAKKCILVLDYDGTIVSLQKRPELAVVTKQAIQMLDKLQKHFTIYVLSGRDQKFLDAQFPNCSFHLAAEHGAFYKEPGGEWRSRVSSDIQSWYPEVQRVMEDYAERVPLSLVETKAAALVWHFRLSPVEFASFQARKLDDELQVGLANLPVVVTTGSKIVEAKAVECNKGSFVRWLLESESPEHLVIGIGDDRTDEDIFRILGDRGITIKVGNENTVAQYRLNSQEDVLPFLQEISKIRESSRE